jgi:hypothetical protein
MAAPERRWIQVVRVLPGRVRLRLPWLRESPAAAAALADGLAKLSALTAVEVRARTGSVLGLCSPAAGPMEAVVDAVVAEARRLTGVDEVVPLGQEPPTVPVRLPETAAIAREVSSFFRGINADVLRATEGSFDLGTAVTAGFVVAGALGVMIEGEIAAPPWFNLAWWGIRTFISFEQGGPEADTSNDGTDD